jgi:predicted RNA-binding Zn-ribbon protein involved in translation (DUF1610 family)
MSGFFETVKNLKHSGPAPKVCPSCGSMRIKQRGTLSGWLLPPMYACEDCGYMGRLVLELEESSNESES